MYDDTGADVDVAVAAGSGACDGVDTGVGCDVNDAGM